jgi:hypothetical protein
VVAAELVGGRQGLLEGKVGRGERVELERRGAGGGEERGGSCGQREDVGWVGVVDRVRGKVLFRL